MPVFPFSVFKISDNSMKPTLKEGDYMIVNRWSRNFRTGDIIVFTPYEKKLVFVKRINSMKNGRFFVLGDNSSNSLDSRKFGWVGREKIIGKLILKI